MQVHIFQTIKGALALFFYLYIFIIITPTFMDIKIIGFRLPTVTPDPSRHSSCGWVAMLDGKEVGWCNMTFLYDNVLKLEDAFVHTDYRGKGIYKMLWDRRMDYINSHLSHYKLIAYCKPITLEFYKKQGFIEKEIITLMEKPA